MGETCVFKAVLWVKHVCLRQSLGETCVFKAVL